MLLKGHLLGVKSQNKKNNQKRGQQKKNSGAFGAARIIRTTLRIAADGAAGMPLTKPKKTLLACGGGGGGGGKTGGGRATDLGLLHLDRGSLRPG